MMRFGKPEGPLNWQTNTIYLLSSDIEVSWTDCQRVLDARERQRRLLKEYGTPEVGEWDHPPIV